MKVRSGQVEPAVFETATRRGLSGGESEERALHSNRSFDPYPAELAKLGCFGERWSGNARIGEVVGRRKRKTKK